MEKIAETELSVVTAETELSVVTATLDLRIHDFFTATKEVCEYHSKNCQNCPVYFSATVFPNGAEDDWLSVGGRVIVNNRRSNFEFTNLKWAVSIIDIEGITRFTRYFENPTSICLISDENEFLSKSMPLAQSFQKLYGINQFEARYLERSFIFNGADEFISSGALFLRCDIYFDFDAIKDLLFNVDVLLPSDIFRIFMRPIFETVCNKNGDKTLNSKDTCTDLTAQVLTLPRYDERRKRFGVYGISPELASPGPETNADTTDILEHVWIFDTRTDRFLLSLAPNPGNVGRLLVNASPVIRQFIETPMKEQLEKRVEFPNVDSETFRIVLEFLKTGEIYSTSFDAIVEVYKFSQMYEMVNLQQKCAQSISMTSNNETLFKEMEEIAELYSDEYLLGLLHSRKRETFPFSHTYVKDDRPNFDFYN